MNNRLLTCSVQSNQGLSLNIQAMRAIVCYLVRLKCLSTPGDVQKSIELRPRSGIFPYAQARPKHTKHRHHRSAQFAMRAITTLLLIISLCCLTVFGGDWPCYHGSKRDNKSADTGLLKTWPKAGPKKLWTATDLGIGYSSVAVVGDTVYTAGVLDGTTFVFALTNDGKLTWKTANGKAWSAGSRRFAAAYVGSRGTPTVDGELLYHMSELGRLIAVQSKTGKEVWAIDLMKKFGGQPAKFGMAESVLIDGAHLICCPSGSKGHIVALDKKTGKTVWANNTVPGSAGYASLSVIEFGGKRQYLTINDSVVYGVDAKSGDLLWTAPHRNKRGNNATDPLFWKGFVYSASGYRSGSLLTKLVKTDTGFKAEKVWASRLLDNLHGGILLIDGHVYGSGSDAGKWFCLDFMTGKEKWSTKGKGSLTYADGMLYLLDERGTVSLVKPSPDKFDLASSFTLPKSGEGAVRAHPVVCGGKFYIRHASKLYVYDIKAK